MSTSKQMLKHFKVSQKTDAKSIGFLNFLHSGRSPRICTAYYIRPQIGSCMESLKHLDMKTAAPAGINTHPRTPMSNV